MNVSLFLISTRCIYILMPPSSLPLNLLLMPKLPLAKIRSLHLPNVGNQEQHPRRAPSAINLPKTYDNAGHYYYYNYHHSEKNITFQATNHSI